MTGDALALDGHGRPLDRIRLIGISATGYHGVFAHERREGQTFVADVVVHLDTRRAAARDDLEQTVDYGALAQSVAAVLSGEPADLVETVAERIAATVLAASRAVEAVDVAVHKPQAPITVPFDDVVVAIRRDRSKLPAAEPLAAPAAPRALEAAPADEAVVVPEPEPVVPAGTPGGDELDRAPGQPVHVVLALGSNVGASQTTLRDAVLDLRAVEGLTIDAVSPLARTVPVGGPEQGDYLNAVVLGTTTLAPRALLRATQAVERAHGRERAERWGPRTLDIDLVVYGSVLAVTDDLELPHPRAHERAFVLEPWSQADPDAVLPGLGGGPVAALAATAPDRDGIRWLALDWLDHPAPGPSDAEAAHGSGDEPARGDAEVVDAEVVDGEVVDGAPAAPAAPEQDEVVEAEVVEPAPVAPASVLPASVVPPVDAPDGDAPFEEVVLDPIDEPVVPLGDDLSETRRLEPVTLDDEDDEEADAPEPPSAPAPATPAPASAVPPAPAATPAPPAAPPAPAPAPYAGAPYRSAAVEGQPRQAVPPVPVAPAPPASWTPPAPPAPSRTAQPAVPPVPGAAGGPVADAASPWSPPLPAATRPAAPGLTPPGPAAPASAAPGPAAPGPVAPAAPVTPPVTAPTAPSAPSAAPVGPPPTAVQPVVPPTVPAPERGDDQLAWLQEDEPRPRPDGAIGWPRRPDAG